MTNNKNIKRIDEAATPQQVMDAIKKRYEAKITYAGDENGKGSGIRIIQPVAYGVSKAGNPVIRAFQPFGDTTTKVPHWKLFRLDRINKWSGLRNRKFDEPPGLQWKADGKFNPLTDKSMSQVYMVADFKGAKERYNDNLRKHNEKIHADKVANDPLYDFKRNVKNSIKATPEIMKRVEEWQREQEKRKQAQQGRNTPQIDNAREMASIKDFGGENVASTTSPVTKNNTTIKQQAQQANRPQETAPKTKEYRGVVNNGPVYKNSPQIPDEENTESQENIGDNEKNNLQSEV